MLLSASPAITRNDLRARFDNIDRVIGHREVRAIVEARGLTPLKESTRCPGDALFAWLEAQRRAGRFDGVVTASAR